MKKFLSVLVAASILCSAMPTHAAVTAISVNFTPETGVSADDLVPADIAGVVPKANWNNAKGSGTLAALADDSGTATGVGLSFLGSSLTNNPGKTTGGGTGDQKMMKWSADTVNESSVQNWWDGSGGGGGARYHQQLLNSPGFGPATAKASFTNLNTVFPGGYDVYVYVKGTSSGYNAQTGAGGYSEANARNAANPVEVMIGSAGLYAEIEGSGYNNRYHFGANGPATQTKGGLSGNVLSNPNLAALGAQYGVAWPCTLIDVDRRIADFDGTYVEAPLGAVDAMPLDWGQMSDNSPIYTPPGTGADYPLNADWSGKSGQYVSLPGDGYQDPVTRNLPVGNYLKFSNLNLDTLDILARNLAGMRVLGAGSTSQIEMGGIAGIQIVARGNWWNGAGANDKWTTTDNWSSTPPAAGSQVNFGASAGAQRVAVNDNTAGTSWSGIKFYGADDPGGNADSYILAGNDVILTGPITNASTNDQTIRLNITMTDGAAGAGTIDTGTKTLTLCGVLGSGGALAEIVKQGSGMLILAAHNSYTVPMRVQGGVLEANDGAGLGAGNLLLDGGTAGAVLQGRGPDEVLFTRALGAGDHQVQWTSGSSGGFAARSAKLIVDLGGDGSGSGPALVWGTTPYFVSTGSALVFGSATADNVVELKNRVNLGADERTISVAAGAGGDMALMSGTISGSGGTLRKEGAGTLVLTAANTYNGPTKIIAGALEANGASLPAASNLMLAGGVFQGQGTFNRALGAAANEVQWFDGAGPTDGGFAARGGTLTVNLPTSPAGSALAWGSTTSFVGEEKALLFGSNTADSVVHFQNKVDLNGSERTVRVQAGAGGDLAVMSGEITSIFTASVLRKDGDGTLVLTGANSYRGATKISQGALEAVDGVGLPRPNLSGVGGSNLLLAGGVFQGAGSFTRALGSGGDEVQWNDGTVATSGGFAARGGSLEVNLPTVPAASALIWDSTPAFVAAGQELRFGSNSADSKVVFQNKLDLGSGVRTIRVEAGGGGDLAEMSAEISGAGGTLRKEGNGLLLLTGGNTYDAATKIGGGALEAAAGSLPSANLELSGGVLQGHMASPGVDATFTRSLGTGSGAVQWTSSGGFAARDTRLVVNLGGAAATVTWASGDFVPAGSELVFGSKSANTEVEFQNNLDLNGAVRAVRVESGAGGDSARISGAISGGSADGLTKTGAGALVLDNANIYGGETTVAAGTLVWATADAHPVGKDLTIAPGAVAQEDGNLGNAVQVGRLILGCAPTDPSAKLDLSGGKLVVDGAQTPIATVRQWIAAGNHGGDWAGKGITSSWANADPVAYAVGYLSNSDFGPERAVTVGTDPGAPATWFGRSATMDSIFVRLTYAGDADLNGEVTTDDFDLWKYGYAESLPATWYNGDLDYSGEIDTDDFDIWKYSYSFTYPALEAPAAAVPEPGTMTLLAVALGGFGWVRWRRRVRGVQ